MGGRQGVLYSIAVLTQALNTLGCYKYLHLQEEAIYMLPDIQKMILYVLSQAEPGLTV